MLDIGYFFLNSAPYFSRGAERRQGMQIFFFKVYFHILLFSGSKTIPPYLTDIFQDGEFQNISAEYRVFSEIQFPKRSKKTLSGD